MPATSRPVLTALSVAASYQERGSPLLVAIRPRSAKGIANGAIASVFVFSALPPTLVSHTGFPHRAGMEVAWNRRTYHSGRGAGTLAFFPEPHLRRINGVANASVG